MSGTKSSEWNNMANLQCSAHARPFVSCLCGIKLIGSYEQVLGWSWTYLFFYFFPLVR